MKTCSKCKVSQPEENFFRHFQKKDGLQPNCKTCQAISVRKTQAKQQKEMRDLVLNCLATHGELSSAQIADYLDLEGVHSASNVAAYLYREGLIKSNSVGRTRTWLPLVTPATRTTIFDLDAEDDEHAAWVAEIHARKEKRNLRQWI